MHAQAVWMPEKEKQGDNYVEKTDEYVEFLDHFEAPHDDFVYIRISCESEFTCYVDGNMVGFGACQNFVNDKHLFTIRTSVKAGKHELRIVVWHIGKDTQTTINLPAYLIYHVSQDYNVLCESGSKTRCRPHPRYETGFCRMISTQLGYSFHYDATKPENTPFVKAGTLDYLYAFPHDRANLSTGKPVTGEVTVREDGVLVKLPEETVGFLTMSIDSPTEQVLEIIYGEHLDENGDVPRIIGNRDFSCRVTVPAGHTEYTNTFRRFAGIYLFLQGKDVTVHFLGLTPVFYKLSKRTYIIDDPVKKRIYDACVRTLVCCMHDHYEDCPWREQALYTMDSRNQMLTGYTVFHGSARYVRENLLLIKRGQLENGLLNICYPSGKVLPIPSFSLVYPLQVLEYVEHTGDKSIMDEVGDTIEKILACFASRIDETGLCPIFGAPCWNFYEWSEGSSNWTCGDPHTYDLPLNAMYVMAVHCADKLFGRTTDVSRTEEAIRRTFYRPETGLYDLSTGYRKPSVLSNSLAVLSGVAGKELIPLLVEKRDEMIPVSQSMMMFFYDALLLAGDRYRDYILADIERTMLPMLEDDNGTIWEYEKLTGPASSRCHGWSAYAPHYYNLFGILKQGDKHEKKN